MISLARIEPFTLAGGVYSLEPVVLAAPALLSGIGLLAVIAWRILAPLLVRHCRVLPPGDPPPRTGLQFSGI